MKKLLLTFVILFVAVSGLMAQVGQTYYYRYVEMIDTRSGKKSTFMNDYYKEFPMILTFTKTGCYVSGKNVKKNSINEVYNYQGIDNNLNVYMREYTYDGNKIQVFLYFSVDYTQLNLRRFYPEGYYTTTSERIIEYKPGTFNEYIQVFERAQP